MKHFKCPHCMAAQSHPECSLYSILECSRCRNLYRLADAIHYEGMMGGLAQWWVNLNSPWKTGQQTACIYCHSGMPLGFNQDGSFNVPDRCPHCTSVLPGRQEARREEARIAPVPAPAPVPRREESRPAPAPAPVVVPPPAPVPAPAPVVVAPPAPVVIPPPVPAKLTGNYKDIYRKAVEENGGKDLTDAQFRELLKRL